MKKHYDYGESEPLDMYLNIAIGEVIRETRNSCRLSLSDVKNRTDMFSRQTLSKYELAKSKVRINTFLELARIYNIEPKELYEKINMRYITKLSEYADDIVARRK